MNNKICYIQKFSESHNYLKNIKEVPKNIICVSLFIKQYDQEFKDKYEDNCINLFFNYQKYLPQFQLILFTDNTICKSNKIQQTIEKSNLNIIIYNCHKLIESTTKEHKGLIGTIMRYFPLFDKEYKTADLILITDIDLKHYNFKNIIHCVNYMQNHKNIQFLFKTNGVLFQNEWSHKEYPQIISILIIARKQFPIQIFQRFLNKITSNKKEKLKGVGISNQHRILDLSYGIDEYFLNFFLMKWIVENGVLYTINTNWNYKLILYSLFINDQDQYANKKLTLFQNFRKKDLHYINLLLDNLNVPQDNNIINRCRLIDFNKKLSPSDISIIEQFIFILYQDKNQRIFTPWQIKFILYNFGQSSSIIFLVLKKLKILEEFRIQKNFNWLDQNYSLFSSITNQ